MRTLLIIAVLATPAFAEHRTWTIARDVYTAEAELVAVRGDTAYLRFGEKVESVPIERLSAADQHYIGTLALAPVAPGPAGEPPATEPAAGPLIVGPTGDVLPVPGEERSLIVPASGTTTEGAANTVDRAVAEESLPQPPGSTAGPTQVLPPQGITSSGAGTWPPANAQRQPQQQGAPTDPANQRFWRQRQQQLQQQQQQQREANARRANTQRDDDDDDNDSRDNRRGGWLFRRGRD